MEGVNCSMAGNSITMTGSFTLVMAEADGITVAVAVAVAADMIADSLCRVDDFKGEIPSSIFIFYKKRERGAVNKNREVSFLL
jgi:hypothetical protein